MPKRVTLKDVAALAGVSYQTVSKVINHKAQVSEDTRRRIWSAVEELRYRPNVIARSLQGNRTRTIGFTIRSISQGISDPFLNELLTSMVEAAGRHEYDVLVSVTEPGDREMNTYERLIKTGRIDGLIVDGTTRRDERLAYLSQEKFPFIAFGRSELDLDFPFVDVDNFTGMYQVIEHLIAMGHQRIAFVGLSPEPPSGHDQPTSEDLSQQSFCAYERRRGYEAALAAHDMPLDPDLILSSQIREEGGYQAAVSLLDRTTPPTAAACCSDLVALGFMRAVRERGMDVGPRLAVSGFDGIPLSAYTHPPLTTVKQPIKKIGELLVNTLVHIIESTELPERQILLMPELIVRQSTTGWA